MNALPDTQALLIELFTEELPPKALRRLGDAFRDAIVAALGARGLLDPGCTARAFCSPRRLAVHLSAVVSQGSDRPTEAKGPSVKIGLDDQGKPTQALIKWAQKLSADIERLERASDGKQEVFWWRSTAPGERLDECIDAVLAQAIGRLPIPKMMEYQLADGLTSVSFVRPAHRLIVLHGTRIVPATLLGLQSGRTTEGHRFQSASTIDIESADRWEAQLSEQGRVMADFEARRARIDTLLRTRATEVGAHLGDEADVATLLDEVCALVEWPAVYVGEFEAEFLAVPQECLILTMRTNQKYFPLFDAQGRLLNRFLIVSNMEVADPRFIVDGNQRVVRPRLADARFFFEQDQRTTLAARVPRLADVVYHARLGTQAQRTERVRSIAARIAELTGSNPALVDRAALLAKADLLSGMVGEFPELQGVMGGYYARHDAEAPEVATAIEEHYRPRFAGDALPASATGLALAMADKLETLAGLFGIGQLPTGDKDPFALRRHALGVLRMVLERHPNMGLAALVEAAFCAAPPEQTQAIGALTDFLVERLGGLMRDRGFSAQEVDAVMTLRPDDIGRVAQRLSALRQFGSLPQASSLAAANKRIGNILRKSADQASDRIDPALLIDSAERELAARLPDLEAAVSQALERSDFAAALGALAEVREAVDRFFDDVMVMAEDLALRGNRLALLAALHRQMNVVADISRLAVA